MENAVQISLATPQILLPADLQEWIDDHTLARLVFAGVHAARLPMANEGTEASASLRPHMLLGLLTYCYARGIYSSTDIELGSIRDTMMRHLCADHCPEADQLRCFRRHNRQCVRTSLTEVLQRAWNILTGMEGSDFDGAVLDTSASPRQGMDPADVLPFVNAAEERILCAVRLDCWASDY